MMNSRNMIFDSSSTSAFNGNNMLLFGGDSGGAYAFRGVDGRVRSAAMERFGGPFFSSPAAGDVLQEDDYYDDQMLLPEKKRRLTPEQVHLLEMSFEAENKLEPERKSELAKKLGLQPRQVAVWFQNRRARWKNKQLERDFDRLKSMYDALVSDTDSLAADNRRLRSEVETLNHRLKAKKYTCSKSEFNQIQQSMEANLTTVPLPLSSRLSNVYKEKVEDHISTRSGGSAVVDGDGPRLVFDNSDVGGGGGGCVVRSEEDGGSNNDVIGRGYFPIIFAEENAVMQQHRDQPEQEEDSALGWWVWP